MEHEVNISVQEKHAHEAQLNLFAAKDNAGNTLMDYDQLPRFLHAISKKAFSPEEHVLEPHKEVVFNSDEIFRIRPAEVDPQDSTYESRMFMYPSTRESLVEEVIIDFARNGRFTWQQGEPGYVHSDTGFVKVIFTMYQLRKRLETMKKSYRIDELTEALRVLQRASYRRIKTGHIQQGAKYFNRADKEFSYISELGFLEKVNEDTPIRSEAVVEVTLSEQASSKIILGDYRSYDCSLSLSFKSPLSRYVYKMISQKWRNATMKKGGGSSFTMEMNATIKAAGHAFPNNITKRRAIIERALLELHRAGVIQEVQDSHTQVKKRGAKIVDVIFLVMPQEAFVQQQILANIRHRDCRKVREQLPIL